MIIESEGDVNRVKFSMNYEQFKYKHIFEMDRKN